MQGLLWPQTGADKPYSGLPAPEYRTEDSFTMVLYKSRPASSQNVIENVIESVIEKVGGNLKGKAKREQVILEMMRLKPNISLQNY